MPNLQLIDVCLPDYFQGSANEVFAVPVDNSTTKQDLRESLVYEYNNRLGDEIANFESLVDDLIANCSNKPLFPNLEPFNDNCDCCYAYIEYTEN